MRTNFTREYCKAAFSRVSRESLWAQKFMKDGGVTILEILESSLPFQHKVYFVIAQAGVTQQERYNLLCLLNKALKANGFLESYTKNLDVKLAERPFVDQNYTWARFVEFYTLVGDNPSYHKIFYNVIVDHLNRQSDEQSEAPTF